MLARLVLTDFRNHADLVVAPGPGFVVLTGENGAGKTNVLEAVSLLAPGRGLRRAALGEMARQGGPGGFGVAATLAASPNNRSIAGVSHRIVTHSASAVPAAGAPWIRSSRRSGADACAPVAMSTSSPNVAATPNPPGPAPSSPRRAICPNGARRRPRPGASSDTASSTLVLPAPFSPVSTTKPAPGASVSAA